MSTYLAAETALTSEQQRQHRVWIGLKDWTDGMIVAGAIKVGTRWQPLKARCVARPSGFFGHWADVTVLEARGYPTMKAACRAARASLDRLALEQAGRAGG
jgi:hypothetical protein